MDMVKEVEHCKVKHSKTSKAPTKSRYFFVLLFILILIIDQIIVVVYCNLSLFWYGCKSM